MNQSIRRQPLASGRRIPLTVNLEPQLHRELGLIGQGNRSKAIETLVKWYLAARTLAPDVPVQ